jgi:hypothetical protein
MAYAKTNQDGGVSIARTQLDNTWVEVTGELPSRQYRNAWVLNGTAIEIDPVKQAEIDAELQVEADVEQIKVQPALKALLDATPNQIENYIDNNVTDLASAKQVLKILAKGVSMLGRKAVRNA